MTGDWKSGPLPEIEGLYWCAGEDQGGYPCISAFRRTCRFAGAFDRQNPTREIPLVWGYQRIDPGIGLSVSEWEKGDLPSRTIGWQRIEQPPHPCRDRWLTAEQRQARRISDEIEALLVEWYGLYWGALQCADIGDGSGADLAVYGLLASGLEYWGVRG